MTRPPFKGGTSDHARRQRVYCEKPGWYAVTQIKGGAEVPLKVIYQPTPDPSTGEINWERPHHWTYVLNGQVVYGPDMLPSPKLWIGREISETEYRYLLEDRKWAAHHAPHLPEAQPEKRADLRSMGAIKP